MAILRTEAGHDPHDKQLQDLVGELSTRSDAFRTRWGAHDVRRHGSGTKQFHHHDVGELTLTYEGLELTAEPGLSFLIYTAEGGSASRSDWICSPVSPPPPRRHRTPPCGAKPPRRRSEHAHQDSRTGPRGLGDRAGRHGHVAELRTNPGDRGEMIAVLRSALDEGVTFFDTADVYGPYLNEELVGGELSSRSATRWSSPPSSAGTSGMARASVWTAAPEQIRRVAEASLTRLRTETIDLFYQHRVDRRCRSKTSPAPWPS